LPFDKFHTGLPKQSYQQDCVVKSTDYRGILCFINTLQFHGTRVG